MADQRSRAGDQPSAGDRLDRRANDGAAGVGDMLGGANAGAGDRVGLEAAGEQGVATIPIAADEAGAAGLTTPMAEEPVPSDGDWGRAERPGYVAMNVRRLAPPSPALEHRAEATKPRRG